MTRALAGLGILLALATYTGHVVDERTDAAGVVEIWIPPQGYVMLAPLR